MTKTFNFLLSSPYPLYTWVERGAVILRVRCLVQGHKAMSPVRARTGIARSGDESANHEASAPFGNK